MDGGFGLLVEQGLGGIGGGIGDVEDFGIVLVDGDVGVEGAVFFARGVFDGG